MTGVDRHWRIRRHALPRRGLRWRPVVNGALLFWAGNALAHGRVGTVIVLLGVVALLRFVVD